MDASSFLRDLNRLQYGTPQIVRNYGICSREQLRKNVYSSSSLVQKFCPEHRLREHQGCVNCINFSFEGDCLVSGSDDLKIVLWDWMKGQKRMDFVSKHVANIFQTKFMPGSMGSTIVSCARDGHVKVHLLSSSGEVSSKTLTRHKDSAHKLSVEPDSPHVFMSCGEDGSVMQMDLRDSQASKKLLVCRDDKRRKLPLYSIFTDPSNSNFFAISGQDQFARIYDKRLSGPDNMEPIKLYCPDHLKEARDEMTKANITCLVYSYDGSELLCSYNDDDIYLFDTSHSSGSNSIATYSGHRNNATVKGVNFYGPRSEFVVSGSDCGNVFLWDKKSCKVVQCTTGDHEGVVNCLEPHPFLPVLAVSGLDHDVKVFTPTAEVPTKLENLTQVMEANKEARDNARIQRPQDPLEALFLRHIMRRMFVRYRRRLRNLPEMETGAGNDQEERSSSSSENESDDSSEPGPFMVHDLLGANDDDNSNDSADSDENGEGQPRRQIARCIQS